MTKWLIAGSILALAGCATPSGPNPMLQGQIGKSEVDLVRSLGVPDHSYSANGIKFVAYEHSYQYADNWGGWGGWGNRRWGGWGDWGPTDIYTVKCETSFEVTGGVVTGYTLHGDGC